MKSKWMPYLAIVMVLSFGLLLSGCKKEEEQDLQEDQEAVEQTEEKDDTDTQESEEEEGEEETETEIGFEDFSLETQEIGDSSDKEDVEYTLASIDDEELDGFHRFEFNLASTDSDELPEVETKLNSSGGFISIRLDRVTLDSSGISYQGSRAINTEGVLKLYHQVTPNASEEVYQVGVADDTPFFLHEDELTVILDVKYPGESDGEDEADDSMDYTDEEVTLDGTNSQGDAKLTGYSWSVGGSSIKFIWGTAAASGNPTPKTSATYDPDDDTVTVTFEEVLSDSVIGSDGEFSAELTTVVDDVTGSRSGTTSTYVFGLNTSTEYRIYRSSSPNQVILEIQR